MSPSAEESISSRGIRAANSTVTSTSSAEESPGRSKNHVMRVFIGGAGRLRPPARQLGFGEEVVLEPALHGAALDDDERLRALLNVLHLDLVGAPGGALHVHELPSRLDLLEPALTVVELALDH